MLDATIPSATNFRRIIAPEILSAAISSCSSNQLDIAVATSIFNSFCAQLPRVVGFQYAPTSAAAQAVMETPPAGLRR